MQLMILPQSGTAPANTTLGRAEGGKQLKAESQPGQSGASFADVLGGDAAHHGQEPEVPLPLPASEADGDEQAEPAADITDPDTKQAAGPDGPVGFSSPAPAPQPDAPVQKGRRAPAPRGPVLPAGLSQLVAERGEAPLVTSGRSLPIAPGPDAKEPAPEPPAPPRATAGVSSAQSKDGAGGQPAPASREGVLPLPPGFGLPASEPSQPGVLTARADVPGVPAPGGSARSAPPLSGSTPVGPAPGQRIPSPIGETPRGSPGPAASPVQPDAPVPRPAPQGQSARADPNPDRMPDPRPQPPAPEAGHAVPASRTAAAPAPAIAPRPASDRDQPALAPARSPATPETTAHPSPAHDTSPPAIPGPDRVSPPAQASGSPVAQARFTTVALSGNAASPATMAPGPDASGDELPPVSELRFTAEPTALHRSNPGAAFQRPGSAAHVAAQITEAIQRSGPSRAIDLTLSPAELGRVKISLHPSDGVMLVNIIADRGETLDLMRRHAELLAQEYHALGFGEAQFSFSRHSSGQDQAAAAPAPRDEAEARRTATEGEDLPRPPRPAGPLLSDRIDIRL